MVGCSLLLAADALREVGLLDEAYFAYHEEVDWCFRARAAGWRRSSTSRCRASGTAARRSTAALGEPLRGRARGARPGRSSAERLPLSWNPVRTYLGARNTVRFMRRHAQPARHGSTSSLQRSTPCRSSCSPR